VDGWDERQDQVSIMTLHAAKGLEFPVVFMPAVEQGILPHERSSKDPEEVEEERRLAFVGVTRAKEELYLSHAELREFRGSVLYAIPSPFLDELPRDGVRRDQPRVPRPEPDDVSPQYDDDDVPALPRPRPAPAPAPRPDWKKAVAFGNTLPTPPAAAGRTDADAFVVKAIVSHKLYGKGLIIDVSGYGAMKKVKVRFGVGEKTFVLDKAPLEIVKGA
jgi:DNA helicase-2/ATP-dependent DNA helicase PcrA